MQALILNSGCGKRMGAFTRTRHKAMALLPNAESIFERQLRLLMECGIREIFVTTGPFSEQLEEQAAQPQFASLRVHFIPNPDYLNTNYIYSMHLAEGALREDVLLLHGDLVFTKALLERMLRDPRGNIAAALPGKSLPEKDFKARLCGERILEVSVSLSGVDCAAFQPLYKLERAAFSIWLEQIAVFITNGRKEVYAEEALNPRLRQFFLAAFNCGEELIAEVDTPEDLQQIRTAIRQEEYGGGQILLAEPYVYLRIPALLALLESKKILLVCDGAYDASFLKPFLESLPVQLVSFRDFSPNPETEQAQKGAKLLSEQGCDALLCVGGGSAMDTAKAIRHFAAQAPPLIVLPSTAGTGSEATPFCALYQDGVKQSLENTALLPDYIILEPALLRTLPPYQKKATLLDALCQSIESLWSLGATVESRILARQAVASILHNAHGYLQGDQEAAAQLLRAAHESGKAIAISKTTAAHAMSYQLTTRFGIAHGHAVALCLPYVWRRILESYRAKCLPREQKETLRKALEDLCDLFQCTNFEIALDAFYGFYHSLEMPPLQTQQRDADPALLAAGVDAMRLSNTPAAPNPAQLEQDYAAILRGEYLLRRKACMHVWASCAKRLEDAALLRSLQLLELEILLAVDCLCKKHHITYYLGEGTLLGAARHGGFIPWDDDVDILMPREDYDRFLRIAPGELPEDMLLQNHENTENFFVFFSKVRMTRPSGFHQENIRGILSHNGPYIDVFPLDYVPRKSSHRQLYHARKIKLLRYAAFYRSGALPKPKGNKRKLAAYYVSRFMPLNNLMRQIEHSVRRYNYKSGKRYIVNYASYYNPVNQTQPASCYGKPLFLPFEGHLLPVPREYRYLLQSIYKRYWQKPPGSKRTMKHRFVREVSEVVGKG